MTTIETHIDPMIARILSAVGIRIADHPHARSEWEELLIETWGHNDSIWTAGTCKGCARQIAQPSPENPEASDDNPFSAALRGASVTVCEPCSRLAARHYDTAAARRQKSKTTGWWESNCPPRIQEILIRRTVERVDWPRVGNVEKWDFEQQRRGLILTGDTGSGKTTALWALARRLDAEGRSLLVLSSIELSRRLQAAAKEMREDRELMDCPHILIDDLGKEKLTATVGAAFYELVDKRLNFNRWMAFTTRFTGDQLEDRFFEAHLGRDIRRRIQDACKHIRFSGGGI